MTENTEPTYASGKICYIEIPSLDIHQSMTFYKEVFGWKIRNRGNGDFSFDDTVGQVSGMWVPDRKPATREDSLLIHIMVFDMQAIVKSIVVHGGKITMQPDMNAQEKVAHFSDPSSNIFGLYQHGG